MAKAPKGPTKSEIYQDLSTSTGLKRKDIGNFFDALAQLVKKHLGKKGSGIVMIPGLLKIKRIMKPATKEKTMPNPFQPGQMMTVKAKPARNIVKAQPLKNLKEMVK